MSSMLEGLLPRQERTTMADKVYLDIKRLLLSGSIPPGEKVTLRGLANVLGTSPMPVRDAVTRLVIEGALDMLPNRGLRVFKPKLRKFREIVKLRCCLEGFAAEEAVGHMDQQTITQIKGYVRKFDRLGRQKKLDMVAVIEANREIHFTLYAAAEMPMLETMIENIWTQIAPVFALSMSTKDRRSEKWESFDHHGQLLRALLARDGQAARDAVVADIRDAAAYIESIANLSD
ncbi:GntR family transcriptional regulator [Pollutimonas subterranea]|uniref:GntR family transcriptional regulator n=1 Tax=Pollutimonas subterranea TaxID=2045210 RepID=A0A2N4U6H7_9BURK|nr:GntR family transcriptional regulator [Pollutimonas subterranea]PLC50624.1 GntR family transcriptional regulator [Pollutimonas subterranea]